ncbi:MAG: prephenate dehydrogenase/arogenate dehydrogenase family protein, partial [Oscillospiraceae bacterium]|nr:prephenate dehydrogenase/arogenate dehydrogenase family protein [Oscillospiraceae bacterium]
FRDLTRIARINETMWSELFLRNREPLLRQMDTFIAEMQTLRTLLADGDKAGLEEKMRLSTSRRALFDK